MIPWDERRTSGFLLILAFVVALAGVVLFSVRRFGGGTSTGAPGWFWLERSLILGAVVITVFGLALLEGVLREAGDRVLSRLGLIGFLFGAVFIVLSEAQVIANPSADDPLGLVLDRIYVALALLSQMAFGGSLVRTNVLRPWLGWTTLLWNLAWLVALPLINLLAGNPGYYYPALHHLMPLLIGIGLLSKRTTP